MRFVYPCDIVLDEEEKKQLGTGREAYTVTFPDVYGATTGGWSDVYGATTGGWSWKEALENAEDALVAALGSHYYFKQDLPLPSAIKEGQQPIPLRPIAAAKVALNTAMRKHGMTKVALAEKLGITESAVRKLCNPDHHSHMSTIERALKVVGLCLVVEAVEKPGARDVALPAHVSASAP